MTRTNDILDHLRKTVTTSPEYGEILPLFIAVYGYVAEHEGATGITVAAPEEHRRERTTGGLPLVPAESLLVEHELFLPFMDGLLALLSAQGREGADDLTAISRGFHDGALDPVRLFTAILGRSRAPVEEGAAACGAPAALLEFVLEIPLKAALSSFAAALPPESADGWREGYCPVCGSRAGMAELAGEEGHRFLSCSCCAFRWPFPRLACPFCGCADPEQLSYFTIGDGPFRVNTCRNCSRYLKTRDSRLGSAGAPLEAEDLTTIHLDLIAVREGFERGK
jgi:FdhE protein